MSGRYLLDTSIVIALFADEAIIKDNLAQANEVFIPSFVIGELCYGARKSGRVQANLARIDELVASSTILGCDTETARRYGDLLLGLITRETRGTRGTRGTRERF